MERISVEKVIPKDGLSFVFAHNQGAGLCETSFWHCHPEYELVYLPRGKGKRFVGNQPGKFQNGDLILLGPNIPHNSFDFGYESDDYEEYVIQFDGKHFEALFPNFREFGTVVKLLEDARAGLVIEGEEKHSIGKKIIGMSGISPFNRLLRLFEVLDGISKCHKQRKLEASPLLMTSIASTARIQQVFRLISEKYQTELSTREVAEQLAMTEASFCRFFSQNTGKTFKAALTEYRIHRACGLLIRSSLPVNRVADTCGYNSISLFNRFFKRIMDISPYEYRKQFQNKILT